MNFFLHIKLYPKQNSIFIVYFKIFVPDYSIYRLNLFRLENYTFVLFLYLPYQIIRLIISSNLTFILKFH